MGAGEAAAGGIPNDVSGALDFLSGRSNGQQFMNPYQQQVIDRMNQQFQVGNEMTMRSTNDAATRAGAFGGSRHGIATGTALAENARNRDQQIANLLYGGFQDATGRAQAAAGLGMQAGSPDLWRLNILRQAGMGLPYGQTYSGTSGQSTSGTRFGVNFGFGPR